MLAKLVRPAALHLVLASTFALAQAPATPAPKPNLADDLRANRTELHIDPTTFALTGPGREVLTAAIAPAHFVVIGEDHITREVPQFASAVCDLFHPTALALETSPQFAQFTEPLLASPDRVARTHALTDRYPFSVAFLNIREEQDLAAYCNTNAGNKLHLWGLDQTFVGSASWIFDDILATHPGPKATAAILQLQKLDAAATATVRANPKRYDKLFLLTITDDQIATTTAALTADANPRAQWLFHELAASRNIYLLGIHGSNDSNSTRATLLKQNFQHGLDTAGPLDAQRVLLKFGEGHAYRGYNPLHQRDLGNYVAELADVHGTKSLHIAVLGVKGSHRNFTGFGTPTTVDPFVMADADNYHWMLPFIEAQFASAASPDAWTLFDLRPLRFGKHRPADPELQRLVDGYDLFVLVPEITPANLIDELPATATH